MKVHILKCWPEPFQAVWLGHKRYEIRKNDRGFAVGDDLLLEEWDPETQKFSGRHLVACVRYMSSGGTWGLPEDLCVMSISPYKWGQPTRPGEVASGDPGGEGE